jgi:hypothetical protein
MVTYKAASADIAANNFILEFKKIVKGEGYSPKQVFNVHKSRIFWKHMPDRTNIAQEGKTAPSFKASKNQITLLHGGNTSGDFKMKPLLPTLVI